MSGQTDSTNIDDLPNGTNQENANMNISVNENPTEYKPINDVHRDMLNNMDEAAKPDDGTAEWKIKY